MVEKRELFEASSLSIHIYALSPALIKVLYIILYCDFNFDRISADQQDPAQYLVPSLTVREHENYHKPSIYGTTTGDAFKPAVSGGMKDGSMNWGATAKKEDKKVREEVKKADKEKAAVS